MQNTVVFDLDGTLANIDHRLHFLKKEPKNWDSFFSKVSGDKVNSWCKTLCDMFSQSGFIVLIVSGRPERCLKDTEKWLEDNMINRDGLILVRRNGDHAPDDFLKEKWLKSYGKERILFVVDDRQRVVDMWRRNGVTCLQCASWKENV
jgi:hypothetical protein